MLGDKNRLLHEIGFSAQAIAYLCSGFHIDATADDIAQHSQQQSTLI
jgi:hypothetical protein